jgi:hypothetical protein
MVYVGTHLTAIDPQAMSNDPALIDPTLPAHKGYAPETTYYPSYANLTPGQRHIYLRWLVTGREDPEIDLGLVFLFFYGLERRLLHDLHADIHSPEVKLLMREIARLRSIYGEHNRSFALYATRLLDFVSALQGTSDPKLPPARRLGEVPWAIRLKVARLAAGARPLGPTWAWAWLMASKQVQLRTVHRRCPRECQALFSIRYRQAFPDGYLVAPSSQPLTATYVPASASFGWKGRAGLQVQIRGLTDAAAESASLSPILDVFESVSRELEPFSRWIGNHPEGRRRADIVALLPPELVDAQAHPGVQMVAHAVRDLLGNSPHHVLPFRQLIASFEGALEMPEGPGDYHRMTEVLHRVGFGMEPDPAFGARMAEADDLCVIFRRPMAAHEQGMSGRFTLAALGMRLAALVAMADRPLDDDSLEVLDRQLAGMLGLTAAERARLKARMRLYVQMPPTFSGLARTLSSAPRSHAHALAQLAVSVATSRGMPTPKAVRTLERIFEDLGFDETALHDQLHDHAIDAAPAPAAPPAKPGSAPQEPAEPQPLLDERVIAARLAESERLADLLGEIFAEEPEEQPVQDNHGGDVLRSMLARLAERAVWPRADFELLAHEYGMPVDGALERLDDLAWETAGESLFDGYDPIEINEYALQQLNA